MWMWLPIFLSASSSERYGKWVGGIHECTMAFFLSFFNGTAFFFSTEPHKIVRISIDTVDGLLSSVVKTLRGVFPQRKKKGLRGAQNTISGTFQLIQTPCKLTSLTDTISHGDHISLYAFIFYSIFFLSLGLSIRPGQPTREEEKPHVLLARSRPPD